MGAHLDRMHVQDKEKEDKEMHGTFRKSFGKSWRSKLSHEKGAISGGSSDAHQVDSPRASLTASKQPCQAYGSAQSQVYPQDDVSPLNKRDWLSRSARHSGVRPSVPDERRRRISDVGARVEKNGEFRDAPRGMYKRFDRLSCSERHPEMDCSSSRGSFSKGFKDKLQKHDISFLEVPSKICVTGDYKEVKGSADIQDCHKPDNAKEHCLRKSSAFCSEEKPRESSFGKSGSKRSLEKHLKTSKKWSSHSTDEAKSRAAALHQWLKHIVRRKGTHNLNNGHREEYHLDEQDQTVLTNANLPNDVLDWGVLKDRNYDSTGYHAMETSSLRPSNAHVHDQELLPYLQRSSSVPHLQSSSIYRNMHADMPRLSEACAGSLRRCSIIESKDLEALESEESFFPRRKHRESMHKRSFFSEKPKGSLLQNMSRPVEDKILSEMDNIECLNDFLRRQRAHLSNTLSEDGSERIKIILSGPDLSLSSMVAAICYAWLIERTAIQDGWTPMPVINTTRQKMWEHRQAAWLFHHCGLDAKALFFCDEVDLENLVHSRQLNILVIGQDALKTDDEVASVCTLLIENYREHAYDLLHHSYINIFLLAGILVDTENLDATAVFFTTRDRVAADLLMGGDSQYNRYVLFSQLNTDHSDSSLEAAMQFNYGEASNDSDLVEGGEEDEALSLKTDTDSKVLITSPEIDIMELSQHKDEMRCSNTDAFDDSMIHSHHKRSLSESASVSGVKVKSNWTVTKWLGFGSRQLLKI